MEKRSGLSKHEDKLGIKIFNFEFNTFNKQIVNSTPNNPFDT